MSARCAHCGADPVHGYANVGGETVCHPSEPHLPDCYRRITVYGESLGALTGILGDALPAGVDEPIWRAVHAPVLP